MRSSSAHMPRARTLAAALRQAREATKPRLSQRAVAQKLGMAHTTIGRWESGESVPTAEDVSAVLAVLQVTGAKREQILALARDSAEADWLVSGPPGISQQLAGVMECERTASHVTSWYPLVIPGPLQTSGYARTIVSRGELSQAEIETRVMLRMGRRDTFTRAQPAQLLALVGEPAIHGGIGGPTVMRDQLRHILEMSKLATITVQVVSLAGDWHPGHAGEFVLYDFDERPSIVYLEHHRSGAFLVDADDVEAYKNAAEEIRREAMSPEESTELIADVLSSLEKT